MFRIRQRLTPTAVHDPNSIVLLPISKQEVLNNSIKTIDEAMPVLHECGIAAREKIVITFSGWDEDPREIFEIEPIRKWTRKAFLKYPHIFYFLSHEINGKNNLATCLADLQAYKEGRRYTIVELLLAGLSPTDVPKIRVRVNFSEKDKELILSATNKYAKKVGDKELTFKEITGIP